MDYGYEVLMLTSSASKKKTAKSAAPAKKTAKRVERSRKHAMVSPGLKGPRSRLTLVKPEVVTSFMARRIISITWQGQRLEAIEGRFAYCFKSPTLLDQSNARKVINHEVTHCSELDPSGVGILQSEPGIDTGRAIKAARRHLPDLLWLEPVLLHRGCTVPNDSYFSVQWGLKRINAERAWDLWGGNPNSVVLAVLDTGIPLEANSLAHPDLNDPTRFFLGTDCVNGDNDPADDHGHGTHIAGIAAANINNNTGIAGLWPGLTLIIKVNDRNNNGSEENFRRGVIQAIDFASQRGAHLVINYSSAGPHTAKLRSAIDFALTSDALVVAPAGNNYGSIKYPAAYSAQYPNVIAVGAVDSNMMRPDFANRGPEMTVVAPGVNIFSTTPNYLVTINNHGAHTKYDYMHGTSQAAPLVSALAALIWSKWPQLSAQQVRDRIALSATPLPGPTLDFGKGLINAELALT
jgi:Subtilase family